MFSTVLIIGAGESGICAGIQLKKQYNLTDFAIYERHSDLGGTWWANTYPGVACDIPAVCYSYSFAKNPEWSSLYPPGSELQAYFNKVCDDYDLRTHITFNTEVESATWDDERKIWSLRLRRKAIAPWEVKLGRKGIETKIPGEVGDTWTHECKVLISGVGAIVQPKDIDLKGKEDFKGAIFHSGVWDHSVDFEGKDVVIVGNGCSAAQIVPAIEPKVKSLTQIARSSHWILPKAKLPGVSHEAYSKWARTVYKYFPGSHTATRYIVFLVIELGWLGFRNDEFAAKVRDGQRETSIKYIKKQSPEKYWETLIPDFPVGCKRRIFDDLYLGSLNSSKICLTKDDISHVTADTVYTTSGAQYKADVIVMSTGYKTHEWIAPLVIIGKNGERLNEHWEKMGGPNAYNSTAVSGFPNFFMLFGPNSATGHSSVILASENMVMYALKMIKPVLRGEASEVEVKREAEVSYSNWIQDSLKKTVWKNSSCRSWYVREDGWNSTTYPFSQVHFIYRSYFPTYSDWIIKKTGLGIWRSKVKRLFVFSFLFGVGALGIILKTQGFTRQNVMPFLGSSVGLVIDRITSLAKGTARQIN